MIPENASSMDRPLVRRRPRWPIPAGAAAAALVVLAFLAPAARRWARAERAVDASTLRFGTVTRGDLVRDLSVPGRVVAGRSPALFSPGTGIVALRTRPGSEVRQGEVLAVIDSPELQAALDQARAGLVASRAELGRQRILARQADLRAQRQVDLLGLRLEAGQRKLDRARRTFEEGLSSRADHEAAQDEVRIATIELEQARRETGFSHESAGFETATLEQQVRRQRSVVDDLEARVAALTVRAPFDGMVATVAVEDGDAVAAHQPVLTVVNLSSLELEVQVPEEYAAEAGPGTAASIAVPGREVPGRVTSLSPEVVQGTLTATVAFDGAPPEGLRQNQRVTTRLLFESRPDVLKVPRGGFLEAEGGRAAYVVEGDLATRREIAMGAASVGEVEIVKGLREGERIVVSDTSAFGGAAVVMLR